MSLGASDQPSSSANKKMGKKHYMIKSLSRLNNLNPSSSQSNTHIPSSTHGSTPSVAYATASTPTIANVTASTPSPRVGSNASTPNLDITPSPYTNLGGTHSIFAAKLRGGGPLSW